MAVALRTFEEIEHRDKKAKVLPLNRKERMETTSIAEYEFPYGDLYQMYDYITNEMGIKQ
jgi:hypothetical protein